MAYGAHYQRHVSTLTTPTPHPISCFSRGGYTNGHALQYHNLRLLWYAYIHKCLLLLII
jgi:hypothetical protein